MGHVPVSCVKGVSLSAAVAFIFFLQQPHMLPGEGTPYGTIPDVGSAFHQGNTDCLMLLVESLLKSLDL